MKLQSKMIRFLVATLLIIAYVVSGISPIATEMGQVVQAAQKPTVTITQKTLYVGHENYTIKLKNLSDSATVTYLSSNKEVAWVTKKGIIKPVKAGKATVTITIKQDGEIYPFKIKVNVMNPKVAYIPPLGSESAVYLSGLDLSKMTGSYYITTKEEYIETTRFVLYLAKGMEVPVNVIELINYTMDTIEEETGYKFYVEHNVQNDYMGMDYELESYFETAEDLKKVDEVHEKVSIVVASHDQVVEAYASGSDGVLLGAEHIKLLDGGGDVLIHELLHIACLRNGIHMGRVLSEGFTTYYTARIIEKDKILNCKFDSYEQFKNYQNIIAEDTMEDLFVNMTAGQSNYELGFRMLHFMIEEYGENAYRRVHDSVSEQCTDWTKLTMDTVATVIKSELSEDFFEAFARWQIKNRVRFGDKDVAANGDWLIEGSLLRKYYGSDTHVVIPNTVTNIQPEAFNACTILVSVEIPDTVTSIGGGAFIDCENLIEIIVPDSVTDIYPNAFENCTSLKRVVLSKSLERLAIRIFMGCTSLTEITLPEGITIIEANAFSDCTALTTINLPSTLKEFGSCVFSNCASLKSIVVPDSVGIIPASTFFDCSSLKRVILPKGLKKIEASTFFGCSSLEKITLPKGVTSIGEAAFDFSGIATINIPDTIKVIEDFAFANCKNLKGIEIPKSVKSIGNETFYGCNNLTIYGVKGSYAEKYAKKIGIKFSIKK